jgi:hypothetical protein
MEECRGPKLCWEAQAVQKGANFHCEGAIIDLNAAVLGQAVGTSRFKDVAEFIEHCRLKGITPGKFATLVRPNTSVVPTKFSHECSENAQ